MKHDTEWPNSQLDKLWWEKVSGRSYEVPVPTEKGVVVEKIEYNTEFRQMLAKYPSFNWLFEVKYPELKEILNQIFDGWFGDGVTKNPGNIELATKIVNSLSRCQIWTGRTMNVGYSCPNITQLGDFYSIFEFPLVVFRERFYFGSMVRVDIEHHSIRNAGEYTFQSDKRLKLQGKEFAVEKCDFLPSPILEYKLELTGPEQSGLIYENIVEVANSLPKEIDGIKGPLVELSAFIKKINGRSRILVYYQSSSMIFHENGVQVNYKCELMDEFRRIRLVVYTATNRAPSPEPKMSIH